LSHQRQHGGDEQVIRGILQYLVEHPDAKDTPEGIYKWWLPESYREQGQEKLEETLDFLGSRRWLSIRRTSQQKKLYGLNKNFMEQIKNYLRHAVDDE
jgi:hypothetical protein